MHSFQPDINYSQPRPQKLMALLNGRLIDPLRHMELAAIALNRIVKQLDHRFHFSEDIETSTFTDMRAVAKVCDNEAVLVIENMLIASLVEMSLLDIDRKVIRYGGGNVVKLDKNQRKLLADPESIGQFFQEALLEYQTSCFDARWLGDKLLKESSKDFAKFAYQEVAQKDFLIFRNLNIPFYKLGWFGKFKERLEDLLVIQSELSKVARKDESSSTKASWTRSPIPLQQFSRWKETLQAKTIFAESGKKDPKSYENEDDLMQALKEVFQQELDKFVENIKGTEVEKIFKIDTTQSDIPTVEFNQSFTINIPPTQLHHESLPPVTQLVFDRGDASSYDFMHVMFA